MAKKKAIGAISVSSFKMGSSLHQPVDVICRILIVCEGEKTEPNYFKSFNRMNRGGVVYQIKCEGGRISTLQVVNKAIDLKNDAINANLPYDSIWAVFDKDSFTPANFNAAIQKAQSNGINCAWSNEAFELWYIYHFANRVTPMSRQDYQKAITTYIRKHKSGYEYQKNDPNMHSYLSDFGNEAQAIKLAEQQALSFGHNRFAEHNPSTWVYRLVKLLRGEDVDFNKRIKAEINGKSKKGE